MVRAIAIVLVVFTHVHEQSGIGSNIIKSIFYDIDRLGVALFFMLSGSFILPKVVNVDIFSFYKKRIPQFVILIFIYAFATTLVHKLSIGKSFTDSARESFIWHNGIYPANYGSAIQLWFMYSIIGLYLVAPFLAKLLDRLTNKEIIIFLCVSVLVTQFKSTLMDGFGIKFDILNRTGTEMVGGYLNFFVLGYFLLHRNIRLGLLSSILLFLIPIIVSLMVEVYKNAFIKSLHWYSTSLQILLSGIGLLSLIRIFFENKPRNKYIESISIYSFDIYLSHYIFIYLLKSSIDFSNMNLVVKLIILFIPTFVCSYIFTWFLYKFKYTRFLVI
ncbi:Uncharacterized protein conserved in bacteria [Mannheimia haemolytica]|nr:Uncharacterized protein conserved in bacteria [Mannheimia haemolytica]